VIQHRTLNEKYRGETTWRARETERKRGRKKERRGCEYVHGKRKEGDIVLVRAVVVAMIRS